MTKVLIVDDEERSLKLYSTILMNEGYEVLTASSAKKGFDMAVSAQPNLILLDVNMPYVDGAEEFKRLSESASTRHIPVIFLTNLITEKEAKDADGQFGGHEYISKSTPINTFIARVKLSLSGTPHTTY